jgi:hypothetical protein
MRKQLDALQDLRVAEASRIESFNFANSDEPMRRRLSIILT